jgi:hypothetical protein
MVRPGAWPGVAAQALLAQAWTTEARSSVCSTDDTAKKLGDDDREKAASGRTLKAGCVAQMAEVGVVQLVGLLTSGLATLASTSRMGDTFDKKPKKSPRLSQQHLVSGTPTNVAVGPLGFRAELDIGTKGGETRS